MLNNLIFSLIRVDVMVGRARHILAFLFTLRSMAGLMMMLIWWFDDYDGDVDMMLV